MTLREKIALRIEEEIYPSDGIDPYELADKVLATIKEHLTSEDRKDIAKTLGFSRISSNGNKY